MCKNIDEALRSAKKVDIPNSTFEKVDNVLKNLEYRKEKKYMKPRLIKYVAVVAACMMITTVVIAMTNQWGILDFLSGRRIDVEVLPGSENIVQKDVPQEGGQTEFVNFAAREAVFDGQNIYIVVEAKPNSPKYLILGTDANPTDPIGNMGPLFSNQSGTITDYASEHNKTMIHTSVGIKGGGGVYSMDFILESDGTLIYMINGRYESDSNEFSLELPCVVTSFTQRNGENVIDYQNSQRTTLLAKLKNTGTKDTVTSTSPVIYSDCGVRVDKITLTGSEMSTYAEIEFTVVDAERFAATDGGLGFEFIDENGERLPWGAGSSGGIEWLDENKTHFIQKDSLRAYENLPKKVTLRGYNFWEKNRYETHIIEMK